MPFNFEHAPFISLTVLHHFTVFACHASDSDVLHICVAGLCQLRVYGFDLCQCIQDDLYIFKSPRSRLLFIAVRHLIEDVFEQVVVSRHVQDALTVHHEELRMPYLERKHTLFQLIEWYIYHPNRVGCLIQHNFVIYSSLFHVFAVPVSIPFPDGQEHPPFFGNYHS